LRAFFAVELPERLRGGIAALQSELAVTGESVRWVRPESLHVTLRFIGEIPVPTAESLGREFATGVAPVPPFELEVRGAGCFPRSGPPRVLWVGLRQGTDQLTALFRHLEDNLRRLGFPPERRPFAPHLTVGRVRGRGGARLRSALERFRDHQWGRLAVDEFVLMESHLSPAGARYSPVHRFPLVAAG
jgi:2'-5' RNA ligase